MFRQTVEGCGMKAVHLARVCCGCPVAVIALCTVISMSTGQVDACNPFWSGCTSISRAARQEHSIHLFRLVMLPLTSVLAVFWWVVGEWLQRHQVPRRTVKLIRGFGWVGAVFLSLYVVFLGTEGQVYGLLRRFGTTTFFGCTGIAQLWLTARLHRHRLGDAWCRKAMLVTGTLMFAIGISYVPAAELLDHTPLENRLEWWFALLMQLQFGWVAWMWGREDLRLGLHPEEVVKTPPPGV